MTTKSKFLPALVVALVIVSAACSQPLDLSLDPELPSERVYGQVLEGNRGVTLRFEPWIPLTEADRPLVLELIAPLAPGEELQVSLFGHSSEEPYETHVYRPLSIVPLGEENSGESLRKLRLSVPTEGSLSLQTIHIRGAALGESDSIRSIAYGSSSPVYSFDPANPVVYPGTSSSISLGSAGGRSYTLDIASLVANIPANQRQGFPHLVVDYGPGSLDLSPGSYGPSIYLGDPTRGTKGVEIQTQPGERSLSIPLQMLGSPQSIQLVDPFGAVVVSQIRVRYHQDLITDLGTMLRYPQSRWRNTRYEVFRWYVYDQVRIFDFADLATQSRYLKRLAFFTEKRGFRGQLLTNGQLEGRHGWNAHNYEAPSLAAFFNEARTTGFRLNPEEEELLDLIVQWGIVVEENGRYEPGRGAVLSVAQGSLMNARVRSLLLQHEALHGIHALDDEYRNLVASEYDELPEDVKAYWRNFFRWMGYDPGWEYLMLNELQAYLLQQSLEALPSYMGSRVGIRNYQLDPNLEALAIDESLAMARQLHSFFWEHYGFIGGDFVFTDYPYSPEPLPTVQ